MIPNAGLVVHEKADIWEYARRSFITPKLEVMKITLTLISSHGAPLLVVAIHKYP